MSGIYITGMEMPKDGFITITVTSDGRVVGNSKKESGKFEYLDNEDIAKAVPVPDHGRLIDADDFFREFPELIPYEFASPTIIPADKEGNGNVE